MDDERWKASKKERMETEGELLYSGEEKYPIAN